MANIGSVTLDEVVNVLREIGGEADLHEIRNRIVESRGGLLRKEYSSWLIYKTVINQVIQYHCPQCKKFFPV